MTNEIVLYKPNDQLSLEVKLENETVWLSQQQMVILFDSTKQNISLHINNIFKEGEQNKEATVKEYLTVQTEGGRQVGGSWLFLAFSLQYKLSTPKTCICQNFCVTLQAKFQTMDHDKWQWQEPGTAWRGVGLYHITLTITSRQPLLGTLVIPNNDPAQARVDISTFGRTLTNLLWDISKYQPDIQMLHYALMPDHLHFIWYVKRPLTRSIREVVSGFWVGAKKLGRAYSYNDSSFEALSRSSRHNYQESLCDQIGNDAYYALDPIFTQMPHIQPMGHNSQLPATIDYLDMNPQRLATKRLKPGFFRVQPRVEINGRVYAAIGSSRLLHIAQRTPVHVRHTMTEAARLGNPQPLNDYIASCYEAARQGSVMVSPFISQWEKDILRTLLQEKRPIIYLAENGFKDYYKPSALLFDAVAEDRLLILSPWPYDPSRKHVSRADCIALNAMAEEICAQ